jgi:hypothetical protein
MNEKVLLGITTTTTPEPIFAKAFFEAFKGKGGKGGMV